MDIYELVNKYNHVFYKAARLFFTTDEDIAPVLERSLTQTFKELINVKSEHEFLYWTLRIILLNCIKQKEHFSKDFNKKLRF